MVFIRQRQTKVEYDAAAVGVGKAIKPYYSIGS
jgi:hypothetical protein